MEGTVGLLDFFDYLVDDMCLAASYDFLLESLDFHSDPPRVNVTCEDIH